MRIEQLEQVIKVASVGSINKAAKELFLSQSNLSQSIKSLEQELKQEIFKRTTKGMELTKFGCEFLVYAQPAVSQFQLLGDYCLQRHVNTALSFSVACQYVRFSHYVFMELYEKYSAEQTRFSFLDCSFLDIVDNVSKQRADLGIIILSESQRKLTLQLLKNQGLIYKKLADCPTSVIIGPNNPYYNYDGGPISIDKFRDYPFVMYKDMNFNFAAEMEEINIHNGKNRFIVSGRASMYECILKTNAYSLAAHSNTAYQTKEYYTNIRTIELNDKRYDVEIGIIHSSGRPLSDLAHEYVDMLNKVLID